MFLVFFLFFEHNIAMIAFGVEFEISDILATLFILIFLSRMISIEVQRTPDTETFQSEVTSRKRHRTSRMVI